MAQYHVPDPEDLLECPYDKTHMIRAKRMPYHLTSCARNHPDIELKECPFNACHRIPLAKWRHHINTCEDKCRIEGDFVFDQERRRKGDSFGGNTSVPPYINFGQQTECTEDWDSEANAITQTLGKKIMSQSLQRKLGFITSRDTDFGEGDGRTTGETQMRLPTQVPKVLKEANAPVRPPTNANVKPVVFELSLSKAGIGRGMKPPAAQTQPPLNKPSRMAANLPAYTPKFGQSNTQNQAALLALSRGRGIGRGLAMGRGSPSNGHVVPGSLQERIQEPSSLNAGNTDNQFTDSPVDMEDEDAIKREKRKLEKKLRQIDELVAKQESGQTLTEEQVTKLACKAEVEARLVDLQSRD